MEELIALANAGQFDRALVLAEKLLPQFAENPALHNIRGVCLRSLSQEELARQAFARAIELDPSHADALNNLATLMVESLHSAEVPRAIPLYKRALQANPEHADSFNNLANAYRQLGDKQNALQCYLQAIELRPLFPSALLNLSQIRDWHANDPLIGSIEKARQSETLDDTERCQLTLALANACLQTGQHKKGIDLLAAGNSLKKKALNYEPKADSQLFQQLRRRFSAEALHSPELQINRNEDRPTPIFIVGLPRSGTSLVEQILACHSKITGCGELPFLTRSIIEAERQQPGLSKKSLQQIQDSYYEQAAQLGIDTAFFTDKMPLNFRWLGYIRLCFPSARIVHVTRNRYATCWSIYRTYFSGRGNGFAYDPDDLAAYYRLYVDLMTHSETLMGENILTLELETLIGEPERQIEKLLAYTSLDLEDTCVNYYDSDRAVATASALQVRNPISASAPDEWRRYLPEIDFLMETLDRQLPK